jgi:xanthine dehydrogenase YagR molybdenum-binding subunit
METLPSVGKATPRIDGIAKVTGAAKFASDEVVAHPAYAYLVTSSIARGRIGSWGARHPDL